MGLPLTHLQNLEMKKDLNLQVSIRIACRVHWLTELVEVWNHYSQLYGETKYGSRLCWCQSWTLFPPNERLRQWVFIAHPFYTRGLEGVSGGELEQKTTSHSLPTSENLHVIPNNRTTWEEEGSVFWYWVEIATCCVCRSEHRAQTRLTRRRGYSFHKFTVKRPVEFGNHQLCC